MSQHAHLLRNSNLDDAKRRIHRRTIESVLKPRLSVPHKKPLLIFDGDCAFCTTWVNRLAEALPVFPDTMPYQWIDLDTYGLTLADVTSAAWLVTSRRQFAGHLAFSAILRMQPRASLRLVGHLMATPPFSWVAAAGYAFVARYRHRLPGGTPACQVGSPA
jgi:predicted DCC family thiol-disulfide oxidoreductase YuxK